MWCLKFYCILDNKRTNVDLCAELVITTIYERSTQSALHGQISYKIRENVLSELRLLALESCSKHSAREAGPNLWLGQ